MNSQYNEYASNKGVYEFPATVRLLDQPAFKLAAIKRLTALIEKDNEPRHYKLLTDVYRRSGDLAAAAATAKAWLAASPESIEACYLYNMLQQKSFLNPCPPESLMAAPFLLFHDFLAASEREQYWLRAVNSSAACEKAGIGLGDTKVVDCLQRNTNLIELNCSEKGVMREKITPLVPELFSRLHIHQRPVNRIEVKLTAHGQGGFFKIHQDGFAGANGQARYVSWIYYFHRIPKAYTGGDLVMFDSNSEEKSHCFSPSDYTRIVPQDNTIVFFPSWYFHGVTPVTLLSPSVASYRFAVVGHIWC